MSDEHEFVVLLHALGSECGVRIISQGMTPHMLGTVVKFFHLLILYCSKPCKAKGTT
jgi:hypothetical protein